jgi:hypothetical protein
VNVTGEWRIGKNVEGSGRGSFFDNIGTTFLSWHLNYKALFNEHVWETNVMYFQKIV